MRWLGLDVHKDFAEVAEAVPGGSQRQLRRIRTTPEGCAPSPRVFAQTIRSPLRPPSTPSRWPALLEQHAGRVIVSKPLRTRAIADAKIKTDKVDAGGLAQLLVTGEASRPPARGVRSPPGISGSSQMSPAREFIARAEQSTRAIDDA